MSGEDGIRPEWIIERQGKKAVLYAGLLHLAHERGLKGITVTLVQCPSDLNGNRAICAASVETEHGVFSDVGDADATNVTPFVIPHIIRMAATRAKARALRDALDIGYVTAEELTDIEALGGNQGGDSRAPSPVRRPSVAVRGGQRVDEDAGRTVSTGWPRTGSAQDDGTATPPQRKLLRELGDPRHDDPALMRADASALISDAIAKKGGA